MVVADSDQLVEQRLVEAYPEQVLAELVRGPEQLRLVVERLERGLEHWPLVRQQAVQRLVVQLALALVRRLAQRV